MALREKMAQTNMSEFSKKAMSGSYEQHDSADIRLRLPVH
jgi:hypothetical protein